MSGKMPPELEAMPDCPAGFDYLWDWFMRLNATRPVTMSGTPRAITEGEMRAFFQNRGINPEPWEVDILVRADKLARNFKSIEEDDEDEEQSE